MKSLFYAIIIPLLLFAVSISETIPQQKNWEEIFFKANQAYREGRFEEAVKGYEGLISAGYLSGHLYFNLGNSYFKLGQLGEAILNFERARMRIPRDPDLHFNLRYSRDQITDPIMEDRDFLKSAFFWTNSLSLRELFQGFACVNILFWGLLLLRLFIKKEWTYNIGILLLIFWLIGAASFGLKAYWIKTDDRAVILSKEVDILAGPDTGDTVLFKLHEGTMVHDERSEDGWSLIRLPDEKRGWIRSETIEKLSHL